MTCDCSTCMASWQYWCRLFDCYESEAQRHCQDGKFHVSKFEYEQYVFNRE